MIKEDNILIRKAKRSDLRAVRKLLEELTNAMDNTECIDLRITLRTWAYLLNDAKSHFLVAATKGTPVGLFHFTVRQTALHQSPSAMIEELVVTKEYQGTGIGKRLMLAAIEKCKQIGCCEIEVSTEGANVKARKFYEECEFEERGILFEMEL